MRQLYRYTTLKLHGTKLKIASNWEASIWDETLKLPSSSLHFQFYLEFLVVGLVGLVYTVGVGDNSL